MLVVSRFRCGRQYALFSAHHVVIVLHYSERGH